MFGLERTVKSGQEKFILKFHHVQNYFPSTCKMENFCHKTQICSAISLLECPRLWRIMKHSLHKEGIRK